MVTSLLSQLQCRVYPSDSVSSLITTLVDGLKCLAKDPMQYMDNSDYNDAIKNSTSSSLCHTVSLESILGQHFVSY